MLRELKGAWRLSVPQCLTSESLKEHQGDRNSPRRDTTRGFYSRRVFARNKLRPAEPLASRLPRQDKLVFNPPKTEAH